MDLPDLFFTSSLAFQGNPNVGASNERHPKQRIPDGFIFHRTSLRLLAVTDNHVAGNKCPAAIR